MTRSEHYCAGKARGEEEAGRDLADGLANHHDVERMMRTVASSWTKNSEAAKVRAHSYGKVRGYRDSIRTLRAGKWGT